MSFTARARDFPRSIHADVSHPVAMPNREPAEKEIDELLAYIVSLRPKSASASAPYRSARASRCIVTDVTARDRIPE